MSVTLAPRARMAVNASWPGVSTKAIFLPFVLDLVGADVLGDAAALGGHDVGLADAVQQRRLAVVDVAQDGDDRRAWLEVLGGVLGLAGLEHVVLGGALVDDLQLDAELHGQLHREVFVDVGVDGDDLRPSSSSCLRISSLPLTPMASERLRMVMGGSISAWVLRTTATAWPLPPFWPRRGPRLRPPRPPSSTALIRSEAGTGPVETLRSLARTVRLARRPARSAGGAEPAGGGLFLRSSSSSALVRGHGRGHRARRAAGGVAGRRGRWPGRCRAGGACPIRGGAACRAWGACPGRADAAGRRARGGAELPGLHHRPHLVGRVTASRAAACGPRGRRGGGRRAAAGRGGRAGARRPAAGAVAGARGRGKASRLGPSLLLRGLAARRRARAAGRRLPRAGGRDVVAPAELLRAARGLGRGSGRRSACELGRAAAAGARAGPCRCPAVRRVAGERARRARGGADMPPAPGGARGAGAGWAGARGRRRGGAAAGPGGAAVGRGRGRSAGGGRRRAGGGGAARGRGGRGRRRRRRAGARPRGRGRAGPVGPRGSGGRSLWSGWRASPRGPAPRGWPAPGWLGRRARRGRRLHQVPDPPHHGRVEAGQGAGLHVQPPLLDPFDQLRTLQPQLFRQLMDTRGQRRLLLGGAHAPATSPGAARSVL